MAGYTKEQYDALYSFRVCRYFGGRAPGEAPVYIHYHRYSVAPILAQRWANMAPILNIASTELVLIVGAGFGWGVESFIAETGCTTIGIDISDYVDAEKTNTEEAEIRQAIIDAGFDPDSGKGQVILNGVCDFQPRTNVVVLNEDMQTNASRNAIRSALGGWPTVVIFEDLIDDTTTDQEITQANNAANLFAGSQRVIWVTNGTATRSLQDLQTLTGSEVISTDSTVYLGGP
jgi:hypothetical protein